MKISELIRILERRMQKHGDVAVQTTWEGTTWEIDPSSVYMGKVGFLQKEGVLFIDANENFSKSRFAADPAEGDGEVV